MNKQQKQQLVLYANQHTDIKKNHMRWETCCQMWLKLHLDFTWIGIGRIHASQYTNNSSLRLRFWYSTTGCLIHYSKYKQSYVKGRNATFIHMPTRSCLVNVTHSDMWRSHDEATCLSRYTNLPATSILYTLTVFKWQLMVVFLLMNHRNYLSVSLHLSPPPRFTGGAACCVLRDDAHWPGLSRLQRWAPRGGCRLYRSSHSESECSRKSWREAG